MLSRFFHTWERRLATLPKIAWFVRSIGESTGFANGTCASWVNEVMAGHRRVFLRSADC